MGVIIGSSEMGLTEQEFMSLSDEEQFAAIERTKTVFEQAGAHYTIETMQELPALIETINKRLV